MNKFDQFLKASGLTAKQFAKASGLSEATVSRLRNGETTKPPPETVMRIRDATGGKVGLDDWAPARAAE